MVVVDVHLLLPKDGLEVAHTQLLHIHTARSVWERAVTGRTAAHNDGTGEN